MKEGEENRESFKFQKDERLHHRSLVETLFRKGKSFYEFPFRVSWRKLTEEELQKNFRNCVPAGIGKLQFMVTVPKKKRRHAVDRVLLRRRIREAYRLNRSPFKNKVAEDPSIGTLNLAVIYIHDQNLSYKAIEHGMISLLNKLSKKLDPDNETDSCHKQTSLSSPANK